MLCSYYSGLVKSYFLFLLGATYYNYIAYSSVLAFEDLDVVMNLGIFTI